MFFDLCRDRLKLADRIGGAAGQQKNSRYCLPVGGTTISTSPITSSSRLRAENRFDKKRRIMLANATEQ